MIEVVTNRKWRWRAHLIAAGYMLTAALLIWRAVELQVLDNQFLQDQGDARHLRTDVIQAHRGMITARNGEPLAVSTPVDSVWVNPKELQNLDSDLSRLAYLTGLEPGVLKQKVTERLERDFVYVRRHMSPNDAARITSEEIPGVYLLREYRRFYPASEVTAHMLGFTNIDDEGQEGLELAFDDWLRGRNGAKRVLRDRLGRTVENVENIRSPEPGKTLVSSIDLRIQYLAYRELKAVIQENNAKSGSIVVVDSKTSEILALANQPSFNPNNRDSLIGEHYRNRAVTDQFEPGSSFKPFPIAAAIEAGRVTPDTLIDTSPGILKVGGYAVEDERNYGVIDVTTVLKRSVNVGASKIALSLKGDYLWSTLTRFGFGSPTGSGLPGESTGKLAHYQRWRPIGQATLAYGYGVAVTPLQLAQAYSIIAEDGVRKPLSILVNNKRPHGESIISAKTARTVRGMMEAVVSSDGTGHRAAVDGYRVAGKTGTARKAIAGGYSTERHVSIFAGMAPVSDPRLVAVVVIDEPSTGNYYGSVVAAPVFSRVMSGALRLLDVPPDSNKTLDDEPETIVAARYTP